MTLEQGAIAALGVVTSAFGGLLKVLWKDMLECRSQRGSLQTRVEKLEREAGTAEGQLEGYENCPSQTCPFVKARPARWKGGEPIGDVPS
jgi:hypothetical protein